MAFKDAWKAVASAAKKFINHPVGQKITVIVVQEIATTTGDFIRNYANHKHTPQAGRVGHPHLQKALTATTDREWSTHIGNAIEVYSAHTSTDATYEAVFSNFFAGIACAHAGRRDTAIGYFKMAYRCGVAFLDEDTPRPKFKDDPEWDKFVAVAEVLDELGPALKGK